MTAMTDQTPPPFDPRDSRAQDAHPEVAFAGQAGYGRLRRRPNRRLSVLVAGAAVLALLASLLAFLGVTGNGPLQWLSPDYQARQTALGYARAAAALDYRTAWTYYAPCYQRLNPEAQWVALKEQEASGAGIASAPTDTGYSVVSVRPDGPVKRVEVRVTTFDGRSLDYEVDVARGGIVDTGDVGHHVAVNCEGGYGP
jgi:hypothetical protein